MEYTITTVVDTNMGDHGERLQRSYPVAPGETVDDLIIRLFGEQFYSKWRPFNYTDEIVLRIVVGSVDYVEPDTATGPSLTIDPEEGPPF